MSSDAMLAACGLTDEVITRTARVAAAWAGRTGAHKMDVITRLAQVAARGRVWGSDVEYLEAWPALDRHLHAPRLTVDRGRVTLDTLLDALEEEMRTP